MIAASATWLVAGGALVLVGKHANRWVCIVVLALAALASVLSLQVAGTVHGLSIQVATTASLLLAALGIVIVVVSDRVDSGAVATFALTMGLCGLSVTSDGQLGSAQALFAASVVVGLRWMACAPGRHTVAGVRSIGMGGALLIGVTPLLPVNQTAIGPWPALVVGLIVGGVVLLLGMLPSGGWTVSLEKHATAMDIAAWLFILVPTTFVYTQRCLLSLPPDVADTARHLLLWAALIGGIWSAAHSLRAQGSQRYVRLLVADISLGMAALMADSWGAVAGLQLLFAAHLLAFAFLCKNGAPSRGWWLVVGSVPPSPGFWARLALAISCASNGSQALTFALATIVLSALGCGQEAAGRPGEVETIARAGIRRLTPFFAATGGAAALFLALDPAQALRSAFGG